MKNNNVFVVIIFYSIILLSHEQTCCLKNTITLKGSGENRTKPNIALIHVSLSGDGTTA